MNNTRGDLVARFTTIVDRLPEERVAQLLKLDDDALLALLQREEAFAEPPPNAPTLEQTAHKSICIPFTIGGVEFEAVGFLRQGEASCLGEEAIRRSDNGHIVRSDAEWQLFYRHRAELPAELRRYWLVTARPDPDNPRRVSYLLFDSGEWFDSWNYLADRWYRSYLVVRRRASSPA